MDDFSFGDSSGFDLGFDTSFDMGGTDLMTQFDPTLDSSWLNAYQTPMSAPMSPGGAGGAGLFGAPGGFMNALTTPSSLLGLGGGLAGLLGTLAGGGVTGTQTPKLPPNALAQIGQANQALQPFAMGQTPLQMQQASMLQALSQGQIPQGYADLVARAYDPAYQDVARRATEAGRQAGFYDAPMSSPPGGAIVGPAAAALQGQQANSLLSLMQSFPQLFNQPIQSQIGAAGQQAGNLLGGARLQTGQQQSVPLAPQIGQAVGAGLQGIGQGMAQNQQMAQQQQFQNSLLRALGGQQQQSPYQFSGYSGV